MTKKLLHVAEDATLPVEVLQDSTTIFGRKRVGKSNNAVVIVEEYLDLHGQVIVLDPKGDWWGMTSSADGKAEGYPLVIIGGKHATLPLNPYAGAAVTDWIVQTGYSVIIDLSQLKPSEVERFCSAFLERLRRLKVDKPGPILVVVDEADELAPEDKNARMAIIDTYAAVVWMVKRGGFAGIGTLVITQRPASLSKNVTTQSETVIVLQVTGSQDVDAIADALKHHVAGETKKDRAAALEELLRSIVQLDKGQAVIVSASPELKGRILTVPFRRRHTFDSGATPKFGEQPKAPKVVAKVALERLSAEMEKAVAEAKANDPALLRTQLADQTKRIRDLEGMYERALAATKVETKRVDVPVLKKGELARLERLLKHFDSATSRFSGIEHDMGEAVRPVYAAIQQILSAPNAAATTSGDVAAAAVRAGHTRQPVRAATADEPRTIGGAARTQADPGSVGARRETGKSTSPSSAPRESGGPGSSADLSGPQQRILDAVAQLASIRVDEPRRELIAGMAKMSPRSSAFGINVAALLRAGYLETATAGAIRLTDLGRQSSSGSDGPSSSTELQARIYDVVGGPRARILKALVEAYPGILTRDELAQRAEMSAKSSAFGMNVSDLAQMGFAAYPDKGYVKAAAVLFLEAA